MANYRDRSSDLRELLLAVSDDESESDNDDIGSDLLDYSSGSEDDYNPLLDYDSDDSRVDSLNIPNQEPPNSRPSLELRNQSGQGDAPLTEIEPQYLPLQQSCIPTASTSVGLDITDNCLAEPWVRVYPPEPKKKCYRGVFSEKPRSKRVPNQP